MAGVEVAEVVEDDDVDVDVLSLISSNTLL